MKNPDPTDNGFRDSQLAVLVIKRVTEVNCHVMGMQWDVIWLGQD